MSHDRHGVRGPRHPLPHLGAARRLGRDEPRPRLLRRLRRAAHRRRPTAHEGHGFVLHHRPRQRRARPPPSRRCAPYVVGRPLRAPRPTSARSTATLTHDSQLRWLGPEKGVMHMAAGAVVNAAWDLAGQAGRASRSGSCSPSMTPEELVALVDFRYLTDALTPRRGAGDPARRRAGPRRARRARCARDGYPAYTTSPGWLGYADDKLVRLAKEAVADGFTQIKLKVGADLDDDLRRMRLAREAVGPDIRIAVDANQRWDVAEAIAWMTRARAVRPVLDRGADQPRRRPRPRRHPRAASPVKVATGEHVANRVVFKQLLQADAVDFVQIDAARVGRGQREPRDPAARRQVRRAGLPARRRRRAVRAGPAPVDVRLRRGLRQLGGPGHRVRRPPPRALRRPGGRSKRGRYRAPAAPGFSARMLPESIAALPLSRRARLAGPAARSTGRTPTDDRGGPTRGLRRAGRPRHRRRLRHRRRHRRRCCATRGARVAVLDLDPPARPAGTLAVKADVTDDDGGTRRGRRGGRPSSAAWTSWSTTRASAPSAPSRTTTTTSGTGSWTSTCSAWSAPPGPPCRTCARAAADRPGAHHQHLLDRRHRRAAAARAVQRQQGRGALADPGDGRRPRPRGHPRQLRQPRHRRHPVGRPAARPGRTTRRPSAPRWRPASPLGRLVTRRRGRRRVAYLASPAAAAVTGTALAVDGGMQGLRLRPAT